MNDDKPKIFLSCGQQDGEMPIVKKIAACLKDRYAVFVARNVWGEKPMVQQIIHEISASDFFMFVDFKREITEKNRAEVSLYAHQELALARRVGLPILSFRKNGLSSGIGMSSGWLDNPTFFDSEDDLIYKIETQTQDWSTGHRNRLIIGEPERVEIPDQPFPKNLKEKLDSPNGWGKAIFYHIPVYNGSHYRNAANCIVYVYGINDTKLKSLDKYDDYREYESIQGIKWVGTTERSISFRNVIDIGDRSVKTEARFVVAFIMALEDHHEEYKKGYLMTMGDGEQYSTTFFESPQSYDLEYAIVSDNFEPATIQLRLNIGDSPENFSVDRIFPQAPQSYQVTVTMV